MVALFLRPDADISDGGWTDEGGATTLFDAVDESSFSDTDYIKSSSAVGDKVSLRLSDPSTAVTEPMTIRIRCKREGSEAAGLTVRLYEATSPATQIAIFQVFPTTSFSEFTYTLTTAEFANIGDFNNLYIECESNPTAILSTLLLHMNGVDQSTTFTDSSIHAHQVSANGDAQIDTAQSKFGGGSAVFDGNDYLSLDGSTDFNFGTGDFTIDYWVRHTTDSSNKRHYGNGADNGSDFYIGTNIVSGAVFTTGAVNMISGNTDDFVLDTWQHVRLCRSSGTTRLFVDGVQRGSDYSDSNSWGTDANHPQIGVGFSGGGLVGHIDELRVIKGYGASTSNFTPPTSAYES